MYLFIFLVCLWIALQCTGFNWMYEYISKLLYECSVCLGCVLVVRRYDNVDDLMYCQFEMPTFDSIFIVIFKLLHLNAYRKQNYLRQSQRYISMSQSFFVNIYSTESFGAKYIWNEIQNKLWFVIWLVHHFRRINYHWKCFAYFHCYQQKEQFFICLSSQNFRLKSLFSSEMYANLIYFVCKDVCNNILFNNWWMYADVICSQLFFVNIYREYLEIGFMN